MYDLMADCPPADEHIVSVHVFMALSHKYISYSLPPDTKLWVMCDNEEQLYPGRIASDHHFPWDSHSSRRKFRREYPDEIGAYVPIRWDRQGGYSIVPLKHCVLAKDEEYDGIKPTLQTYHDRDTLPGERLDRIHPIASPREALLRSFHSRNRTLCSAEELFGTSLLSCYWPNESRWLPAQAATLDEGDLDLLASQVHYKEEGEYCMIRWDCDDTLTCLPKRFIRTRQDSLLQLPRDSAVFQSSRTQLTPMASGNHTTNQEVVRKHKEITNLATARFSPETPTLQTESHPVKSEEKGQEHDVFDTGSQRHSRRWGQGKTFPYKLYHILEEAESEGKLDVISFFPHGLGFAINNRAKFIEEFMPRYFKSRVFSSFEQQLIRHGFEKIKEGKEKGGYRHKFFSKGRKDLLNKIVRKRRRPQHRQLPLPCIDPIPRTPSPDPALIVGSAIRTDLEQLPGGLDSPLRPQFFSGIPLPAAASGVETNVGMPISNMPTHFASSPQVSTESFTPQHFPGVYPSIVSPFNHESRVEDAVPIFMSGFPGVHSNMVSPFTSLESQVKDTVSQLRYQRQLEEELAMASLYNHQVTAESFTPHYIPGLQSNMVSFFNHESQVEDRLTQFRYQRQLEEERAMASLYQRQFEEGLIQLEMQRRMDL